MSDVMQQDIPVGYTQFPSLSPEERGVSDPVTISWDTDGTCIPLDILVLSWAALLRSLTGEDYPTFILDGQPIQADLSTWSFKPIEQEVLLQDAGGCSGIFTNSEPGRDGDLLVAVGYDLDNGTGYLRSTLGISSSYLTQITYQVKRCIHLQLERSGLQISIPVEDDLALSTLNPNPQILPGAQFLHHLLSTKEKSSIAIEFLRDNGERDKLSYASLDHLSTRLALRLIAALRSSSGKQQPDDVIPILIPQSTNLYIALLAILKAGAAYCPLNLDAPLERITFILNDVAAGVVVTTNDLAEKFQNVDQNITIICIDGDLEETDEAEHFSLKPRELTPENLAYVMYTSGSTGLPKGVGVSHGAATQSLLAHDDLIPKFTRFLQFAATTFDVSVFEIFFPLFRGATLVGCDRGVMLNDLPGSMRKLEVDASELTPTVATELLRSRQAVPSLRVLLTIGEMLTRHVIQEFGFSPRNEGILQGMYGPTEAAIHCTMARNVSTNSKSGIIGCPFPTVSAHIVAIGESEFQLDDELGVLPLGHIGELAFGGHQLASSYINRPEENAKAFVDTCQYGRVYRTGDRARLLPSGEIEMLGRISGGQVKLRGQRLELGEIEHVVCKADDVRNAVASVVDDILIVSVLVDNDRYSLEAIRQVCRRWLPKFMIPGDFIFLTELPRLPSGKIDRRELERTYALKKRGGHSDSNNITNASEKKIAICVGETLSTSIGSSNNLSAAGLDSLTAIRLSTRLRAIGVEVDVAQILEADTVHEIWLAAKKGSSLKTAFHPVSEESKNDWNAISQAGFSQLRAKGWFSEAEDVIPCSPTQVSMLSESVKNPRAYFNRIELEFQGGIEEPRIKDAFFKVAQHNEILRSSFIEIDFGGYSYAQVVWKSLPDSRFSSLLKSSPEVSHKVDDGFTSPFRIQLDSTQGTVKALVHIHHALYDGWSWELILNDVQDILSSRSLKPRAQHRILTEFYRQHRNSEYLDSLGDYWQDQLQDVSPTLWPNFNDRSDIPPDIAVSRRPLDINLSAVDSASRDLRIGRPTVLQAAFAYILSTYAGSPDVVFGSVSSGRTLAVEGIEDMIGPCINTLPMRLNIGNSRNVRDLLAVVHTLNRGFIKYGALPLGDIKKASGVSPTSALFDSLFIWQETLLSNQDSSLLVSEINAEEFLEFTMTLEIELSGDKLTAKASYLQSVLSPKQVDILLDQIEQVASLFMNSPDLLLEDINSHLEESVLSIGYGDHQEQKQPPSLVTGVEIISKEDPERISIQFLHALDSQNQGPKMDKLTYLQLNNRANQVAHYILSHGVNEEGFVGILLEKSIEFYVSVLSVIKAGYGYIPITPSASIGSIRRIINESQCQICITSSSISPLLEASHPLKIVNIDSDEVSRFPEHNVVKDLQNIQDTPIAFTPGTEEEPEGIIVSRQSIRSSIETLSNISPKSRSSRWLNVHPSVFSGSVFDIFFSWNSGMTLCSTADNILSRDIGQVIRTMGVTHLNLTPACASVISPNNVPNVEFLLTSGEELTPRVFKDWAGRGLHYGYAPSGKSNICTLKPKIETTHSMSNIGKPLLNTSAFVISSSETFSLAPKGAVGELYFGGDLVTHAYTNNTELAQKKIFDHPKYGRLCNSGDLGRLLPDGSLVFVGRHDDQPRFHGQHVDLGEISRTLLESTKVKDSLTIMIKDNHSEHQWLVSFWVPNRKTNNTELPGSSRKAIISLFDEISVALPDSMIPSYLVPIQSIPIKASGQTDKRKLIDDFWQQSPGNLELYAQPSSSRETTKQFSNIEETIARVLANITHVQPADIQWNTSFFSLGLNSISAITFARRLRREGLDQVDISSIMRHSSVSRLSNLISRTSAKHASTSESNIELETVFDNNFVEQRKQKAKEGGNTIQRVMPCTPLQEAMLSQKPSSHHSAYYNHLTFEVLGDVDKLHSAWLSMKARHDILRTCFFTTDNARYAFAQVVLKDIELPWKSMKVSAEDIEAEVESRKAETMISENEFDVPYSLTLFTSSDCGKKLLLLSIHHALYDAEAMSELLQDVENVYFGFPLQTAVPFDKFLQKMVSTDQQESDRFWDTYMDGHSTASLVTSLWGSRRQDTPKEYQSEQLIPDFSLSWLEKECRRMSTTVLGVFQTAWANLLKVYTGQSDVCFGNVFSCRTLDLEGAERIVGPCFNTLPVRARFSENSTNLDIIKNLQKSNADILSYQLSSLRRIQQRSTTNGARLFDTLLLLQNEPRPLNDSLWRLVGEEGDMDFPIVCEIIPEQRADQIHIHLHFDASHVPAKDIRVLMENYGHLIEQILQFPSTRAAGPNELRNQTLEPRIEKREHDITHRPNQLPNGVSQPLELSHDELEVAELLAKLSGVETAHIGPETTIFQLGLDSINAVQIAGRLRDRGFTVSSGDVLENPSVQELAVYLQSHKQPSPSQIESFDFQSFERKHRPSIHSLLDVPESAVEYLRPCTPVQAGILAMFTHSDGDMYFNHVVYKIPLHVEPDSLSEAWAIVSEKHEMLRTGFVQVQDERCPFGMITYRKGTFELPWSESSSIVGKPDFLSQERNKLSRRALANMHHLPWHLTLQNCGSYRALQFSALHAIFDAQALELIVSDVVQAYNGKELRDPVPVSTVIDPILSSGLLEAESEKFWENLGNEFQVTKFPDLSPVHVQSNFDVLTKSFSAPISSIEEGCRSSGITLTAAGQLSWARILAAYTGATDVTYGLVLSGRNISEEANDVVFPCLTTVPAPCKLEGTNAQVLKRIMKTNASLAKYQFTSLSKIHRWSNSDPGLFDTIFVHQKLSSSSVNKGWEVLDEEAKVEYPISIELVPRGNTLDFVLTFKIDILPKKQAELLLEQLDSIFIDSVFSPESNSGDLSMVNHNLLSITPAKEAKIKTPINLLHQFVEVQAAKNPAKTALEFISDVSEKGVEKKTWTYQQLDEESNRYARMLQSRGATTGNLIGICFDKCPEAYFSILAILKAGCAYVALDPTAPISRKCFIVEDSGCNIILCTSTHKEELKDLPGATTIATDAPGILDQYSSLAPSLDRPVRPDDTSYCLYTSGTTGTPKGCEITHDNAVQAMLAFQRLFAGHWDEDSRWLQFASFHFDVSVLEQYWSWGVGICVTSCPRDVLFGDLAGVIHQLEITHIDLTPSLARLITPREVPSLCRGVFITGGEKLNQEVLDIWGESRVIYNAYGPTEATIGCTTLPRLSKNSKPSNIGPQFDNVGSFVFNPNSDVPVMRGCIGELCVSGPLVGRGYLNRPELTEEKFQLLEKYDERVYRTGDLVRILHDGSFSFLGRIDDQVKLRGQRLEIGEINEVVRLSTTTIKDVCTLVLAHPKQSKEQLVSFVVSSELPEGLSWEEALSRDDARLLVSQIRTTCTAKLPGYMVPTHIIPMSAFPLSPNNKVDSRKMKDMYGSIELETLQKVSSSSIGPHSERTATVEKIASYLSSFVGCRPSDIEPASSIFALGLDSISVIAFARALRNAGFVSAEPSLIMKNPQVAQLSTVLELNSKNDMSMRRIYQDAKQNIAAFVHSHLLSISRELNTPLDSIEGVAPCTPLQEGMIYRALESQGQLYYSSFRFELEASTDIPHLKASWASVQSSVGILRTRFTLTSDGYAQVVAKNDILPWFDYTASSDLEADELIKNHSIQWQNRSGSKFGEGLWSVGVVRSPEKIFMSLNLFHALFDGNSLPLLLRRVGLEYSGETEPSRAPTFLDALPFGPLSKNPKAETFWLDHLKGLKHRRIPITSSLRDQSPTAIELDLSGLDCLETVRRRLNVTEQSILHACWLLTLKLHFGFIPTIGIIVSGRVLEVEDAEDIIGPMFNTIPSHIQFHGLSTVSDLIRKCHSYYASTLPFQHTPLRDITKWVGRSPDEPIFDSLFAFQRDNENAAQATEQLWSSETSHAEPDYPLAFEARRRREGFFTISVVAQPGVMCSETGEAVLSQFRDTLFKVIEEPDHDLPTSYDTELDPNELAVHGNENGYVISNEQHTVRPTSFEWTPDATRILEEISTLSGVDKSSIHESSSILELGLDSIDAIKLSSRLNKAGIGLSVSAVMQCRTLEKMASQIVTYQEDKADSGKKSIYQLENEIYGSLERDGFELSGIERVLPATPLQEAMAAEMISSEYTRYFNHEILELAEDVDVDNLQCAWNAVIKTHPILRTSFAEVSDPGLPFTYAQAIHTPESHEWEVTHAEESAFERIMNEEKCLQANDHPHRRPPLRLRLIIDGNKRFLLLSIAHALYDGWSLGLLHQDVASCYTGESCSRPSYHGILKNILNSSGTNAVDFWKGFLANVQPADFPKQPQSEQDGVEVHRKETKAAIGLSDINEFCRKQGVTIQALALTCWALVLAGYLGKLDVVFGVVLSGRSIEEGDQIMFPTMNTVAMRAILHGSRSQMLKYVQETIVNISEYQHFPLRKAKSESGVGAQALFDTLFIYQKTSDDGIQPENALYKSVAGSADLEYPVCVEMEGVGESLVCRLACKDSVLGLSDTTKLLERIQEVLRAIIYQPNEPTVEFMGSGVSICGSPVYREADDGEKETLPDNTVAYADIVWSSREETIRQVLSAVSGTPETEITKNTSLFHLGLDSISAIKVSSLLKKQSVSLSVSDMLRAGTISNMARVLGTEHVEPKSTDIDSVLGSLLEHIDTAYLLQKHDILSHDVEKLIPATAGQTYVLAMSSVVDEHVFFPDFFYHVNGELTPERLEEAWKQLVVCLPILRTAFIPTGQRQLPFFQAVLKRSENPIVWYNGSEESFNQLRTRPAISSVPATLLAHQMSGKLTLKLQIHHAMYDAVSLPKLVDTLVGLCNDPSWHVDSKVDISELVAFNSVNSPIERRRLFWEDYLSGVHMKVDSPRRSVPRPEIVRYYRPGLIDHVDKIEDQARRHGLSVHSLFLAAYAKMHAQLISCANEGEADPESIVIGVYLANRSHQLEGLPDLIAPSLNVVPLRVRKPVGDPILEVARGIQASLHEIGRVENSCVSLLEIADWTGVKLDTFANFLKLPDSEQELQLEPDGSSTKCQDKSITFVPVEAASEVEQHAKENNAETIVPRQVSHGTELAEKEGQERKEEEIARSHAHAQPALTQSGSSLYDDGVFKPSIDVEAAIRDNKLDVGIFGPGDRIDERTAADILDALRLEIENILLL